MYAVLVAKSAQRGGLVLARAHRHTHLSKYSRQVCFKWGSLAVANVLARPTLLGLKADLKYLTAAILFAIRKMSTVHFQNYYGNKLDRNYKFLTIIVTLTNTKEIIKKRNIIIKLANTKGSPDSSPVKTRTRYSKHQVRKTATVTN